MRTGAESERKPADTVNLALWNDQAISMRSIEMAWFAFPMQACEDMASALCHGSGTGC